MPHIHPSQSRLHYARLIAAYRQQEQSTKKSAAHAEQQGKQAWGQAEQQVKQPAKGMRQDLVKSLTDAGRPQVQQEQDLKRKAGAEESMVLKNHGAETLPSVQAEAQAKMAGGFKTHETRMEDRTKRLALAKHYKVAVRSAEGRLTSQQQELVAKRDELRKAASAPGPAQTGQEQKSKLAQEQTAKQQAEKQAKQQQRAPGSTPQQQGQKAKAVAYEERARKQQKELDQKAKQQQEKDHKKDAELLKTFRAQQDKAIAKHKQELAALAQQEAANKARTR